MVIIHKIIRTKGGSYLIFIPKNWVEDLEKNKGKKIIKMRMFLNGKIRCEPIFGEEKSSKIIPPSDNEKERLFSKMEVC